VGDPHNVSCLDPVRSAERFYGRRRVTRQVLGLLTMRQNVSIVGPDRVGKTSFLYHVADPQVRAQCGLAEDLVFVYVDGRRVAAGDPDTWYRHIKEATIQQVGQVAPESESLWSEIGAAEQSGGPSTAPWRFQRLFRAIKRRQIQLVLVLDNFEVLAKSPKLDASFFGVMRSLHANYQVTYLVASLLPLHELEPPDATGSPFFNMFFPVQNSASDPFGPLTPQESRELVMDLLGRKGIETSEQVIECILELGKDRPYTLKRAAKIAAHLWKKHKEMTPQKRCRQIRKQFDQR
jgi:hypothetical protein